MRKADRATAWCGPKEIPSAMATICRGAQSAVKPPCVHPGKELRSAAATAGQAAGSLDLVQIVQISAGAKQRRMPSVGLGVEDPDESRHHRTIVRRQATPLDEEGLLEWRKSLQRVPALDVQEVPDLDAQGFGETGERPEGWDSVTGLEARKGSGVHLR